MALLHTSAYGLSSTPTCLLHYGAKKKGQGAEVFLFQLGKELVQRYRESKPETPHSRVEPKLKCSNLRPSRKSKSTRCRSVEALLKLCTQPTLILPEQPHAIFSKETRILLRWAVSATTHSGTKAILSTSYVSPFEFLKEPTRHHCDDG